MSANYIPPMTSYSQPHQYINITDNAATSLYSQYLQTQHDFISSILATATSSLETKIMSNILKTLEQDQTKTQNIMMITLCQLAQKVHCNGALLENVLSKNDDEKSQQNLRYTLTSLNKHQNIKLQTIENELVVLKKHLKSNENMLKYASNQLDTLVEQSNAKTINDPHPKAIETLINKINKMDKKLNLMQNKQLKLIKNNQENINIIKQTSIDNNKMKEMIVNQSTTIQSIKHKQKTLTTSRQMSALSKQVSTMQTQISQSNASHKQISSITEKISSLCAKISSVQTQISSITTTTHPSQNISKIKSYHTHKTAPLNAKQIPNTSSQHIDPFTTAIPESTSKKSSPTKLKSKAKHRITSTTLNPQNTTAIDDTNSAPTNSKIYPTNQTPMPPINDADNDDESGSVIEIESARIVSENSSTLSAIIQNQMNLNKQTEQSPTELSKILIKNNTSNQNINDINISLNNKTDIKKFEIKECKSNESELSSYGIEINDSNTMIDTFKNDKCDSNQCYEIRINELTENININKFNEEPLNELNNQKSIILQESNTIQSDSSHGQFLSLETEISSIDTNLSSLINNKSHTSIGKLNIPNPQPITTVDTNQLQQITPDKPPQAHLSSLISPKSGSLAKSDHGSEDIVFDNNASNPKTHQFNAPQTHLPSLISTDSDPIPSKTRPSHSVQHNTSNTPTSKPIHNTTTTANARNTILQSQTHDATEKSIDELKHELNKYLKSTTLTLPMKNTASFNSNCKQLYYHEDHDHDTTNYDFILNFERESNDYKYKIDANLKTLARNPFLPTKIMPSKEAIEAANEYKEIGNECYHNKDFEGAIQCYELAQHLDPTNAVYILNGSAAMFMLADYENTILCCEQALLYTKNIDLKCKAYKRMGAVEKKRGNINQCIEYYKIAQHEKFDINLEKKINQFMTNMM